MSNQFCLKKRSQYRIKKFKTLIFVCFVWRALKTLNNTKNIYCFVWRALKTSKIKLKPFIVLFEERSKHWIKLKTSNTEYFFKERSKYQIKLLKKFFFRLKSAQNIGLREEFRSAEIRLQSARDEIYAANSRVKSLKCEKAKYDSVRPTSQFIIKLTVTFHHKSM
jgi:hypothetical protein